MSRDGVAMENELQRMASLREELLSGNEGLDVEDEGGVKDFKLEPLTPFAKAKLLADLRVGTVAEFRRLLGPQWTGKRGHKVLVLLEDRNSDDVKAAVARLDLAARGLEACPDPTRYVRLRVLELSHNLIQKAHRSVWALKELRRLDLRRSVVCLHGEMEKKRRRRRDVGFPGASDPTRRANTSDEKKLGVST